MGKLLHAILLGLLGAGIVHIAILFLLPAFSERDAWSRLDAAAELYTITPIDGSQGAAAVVKASDPLFDAVACRFDLSEGIVHIKGDGGVPFWSASVYDRNGQNIYSFNDRTAAAKSLDFVVASPAEMIEVRKDLPPELETSIFVEAPVDEGIVVVRAFIPDESWKLTVSNYLNAISCSLL